MKQYSKLTRWIALLLLGIVALTFAACEVGGSVDSTTGTTAGPITSLAPNTETETEVVNQPGTWTMEVRGIPGVLALTSDDAQYLPKVSIDVTLVNDTGIAITNTYSGVTLKSILHFLGVINNVSGVVVTSVDGYAVSYDPANAMSDETVLAWEKDGALIETIPPIRMTPKNGAKEMHVAMVASISVSLSAEGGGQTTPPGGVSNNSPWDTQFQGGSYATISAPSTSRTTTRRTSTRSTSRTTRTTAHTGASTTSSTKTTATATTAVSTATTKSTTTTTTGTTSSTKYIYTTKPTTTTTTTTATTTTTTTTTTIPKTYPVWVSTPEDKSYYDAYIRD
ncbi:MAG: molybdopterin-dependent oxidoreductase [Oscillospiraceae bacterium]|jgi:hypothetical protein|nr:molybdopterin-dependent oxidoreductase [Oscillospiraceae bacterium]